LRASADCWGSIRLRWQLRETESIDRRSHAKGREEHQRRIKYLLMDCRAGAGEVSYLSFGERVIWQQRKSGYGF